jgi:hypothetical protein
MKTMTATVDAPNDETPMSKDLRYDGAEFRRLDPARLRQRLDRVGLLEEP